MSTSETKVPDTLAKLSAYRSSRSQTWHPDNLGRLWDVIPNVCIPGLNKLVPFGHRSTCSALLKRWSTATASPQPLRINSVMSAAMRALGLGTRSGPRRKPRSGECRHEECIRCLSTCCWVHGPVRHDCPSEALMTRCTSTTVQVPLCWRSAEPQAAAPSAWFVAI